MSDHYEHRVAARRLEQSIGRLVQSFDTVQLARAVKFHFDLGLLPSFSDFLHIKDHRLTVASSYGAPSSTKTTLLVEEPSLFAPSLNEQRDYTSLLARVLRAVPVVIARSATIEANAAVYNASAAAEQAGPGAIRVGRKREQTVSNWRKHAGQWRSVIGPDAEGVRPSIGESQQSDSAPSPRILSRRLQAIPNSRRSEATRAFKALDHTTNRTSAGLESGWRQSNSIVMSLPQILRTRRALSASAAPIQAGARLGRSDLLPGQVGHKVTPQVRHTQAAKFTRVSSATLQQLLEALAATKRDRVSDADELQATSRNRHGDTCNRGVGEQTINYSPTVIVNATSEFNDIEGRVLTTLQNHSYELSRILAREVARRERSEF